MATATEEYYEVFAAERAQEPPRHVGTVRARSVKDAAVFAHTMYDEFRWAEMFIVPRRSIIPVVRPE
jgi:1,2-phenylacetyl-CoA epoxidase PaaB subunit